MTAKTPLDLFYDSDNRDSTFVETNTFKASDHIRVTPLEEGDVIGIENVQHHSGVLSVWASTIRRYEVIAL